MMKLQESKAQSLRQITTLFNSNHTQIRILISNGHKAKEGNGPFDLHAFITEWMPNLNIDKEK